MKGGVDIEGEGMGEGDVSGHIESHVPDIY